jgi:hypothetical protein
MSPAFHIGDKVLISTGHFKGQWGEVVRAHESGVSVALGGRAYAYLPTELSTFWNIDSVGNQKVTIRNADGDMVETTPKSALTVLKALNRY